MVMSRCDSTHCRALLKSFAQKSVFNSVVSLAELQMYCMLGSSRIHPSSLVSAVSPLPSLPWRPGFFFLPTHLHICCQSTHQLHLQAVYSICNSQSFTPLFTRSFRVSKNCQTFMRKFWNIYIILPLSFLMIYEGLKEIRGNQFPLAAGLWRRHAQCGSLKHSR